MTQRNGKFQKTPVRFETKASKYNKALKRRI